MPALPLKQNQNRYFMKAFKIAIIGVGPKGLYGLERLLAQFAQKEANFELEILLFEKSGHFGCGEIYDPSQPDYLLMNYPNRNINVWPKENPAPIVAERLSFVEWLADKRKSAPNELLHTFSPRKEVGQYLVHCYEQLKSNHPKSIRIFEHALNVNSIRNADDGFLISANGLGDDNSKEFMFDRVLITTGHSSCSRDKSIPETLPPEIPSQHFVDFIYPVQEKLKDVPAGAAVGIKGMGLTFIDAVLALTEGRGGEFRRTTKGTIIYLPSGDEPKSIFPFSKSGMPMVPRSGHEGLGNYKSKYFTIDRILGKVGASERPSFVNHILPLLIAETEYRYYEIAFDKRALTLYPDEDFTKVREQIEIFHETYPEEPKFGFGNLFNHSALTKEIKFGPLAYLRQLLQAAKEGSKQNAYMNAAMTWGKLSEDFNKIYSHGGMTPDSHWLFDKKYRSKLNRVSYGPPLENFEKLIALMETGLLNFDFARNPRVDLKISGWTLVNMFANSCEIDVLIDARIPVNAEPDDWCPLFKNMRKNGIIRPMQLYGDTRYSVGCPEINELGQPIDSSGKTNSHITFYGTPTEGATYDNDTLSRTRNNFVSQWAKDILNEIALQAY